MFPSSETILTLACEHSIFVPHVTLASRLKSLVAIPKVQPRFAIAIWKKYPTMKSLLSVYMDRSKSVCKSKLYLSLWLVPWKLTWALPLMWNCFWSYMLTLYCFCSLELKSLLVMEILEVSLLKDLYITSSLIHLKTQGVSVAPLLKFIVFSTACIKWHLPTLSDWIFLTRWYIIYTRYHSINILKIVKSSCTIWVMDHKNGSSLFIYHDP